MSRGTTGLSFYTVRNRFDMNLLLSGSILPVGKLSFEAPLLAFQPGDEKLLLTETLHTVLVKKLAPGSLGIEFFLNVIANSSHLKELSLMQGGAKKICPLLFKAPLSDSLLKLQFSLCTFNHLERMLLERALDQNQRLESLGMVRNKFPDSAMLGICRSVRHLQTFGFYFQQFGPETIYYLSKMIASGIDPVESRGETQRRPVDSLNFVPLNSLNLAIRLDLCDEILESLQRQGNLYLWSILEKTEAIGRFCCCYSSALPAKTPYIASLLRKHFLYSPS